MDLCAVHVKNTTRTPLLRTNSFCQRPVSCSLGTTRISFRIEEGRVFEVKILKRKVCCKGYEPFIVRAMGKKNRDNSSSSGEDDIFCSSK